MKPFYTLSSTEHDELRTALTGLPKNPYTDYPDFSNSVQDLIDQKRVPNFFIDVMSQIVGERATNKGYAHVLSNVPIDDDVPDFDTADAVNDKYVKKTTFVGEALLQLVSKLTDTPLIAYSTRNNADFFHDVYPMKKYSGTQTQKSDSELFWHNDRTAHEVRADYLALLGMKCTDEPTFTGYIDGRELLAHLEPRDQETLRECRYVTRFDRLSRDSNPNHRKSDQHAILSGEHQFRYFDTRTLCAPDEPRRALEALSALRNAITEANKVHHQIRTKDLFLLANQSALHCRSTMQPPTEHSRRWLLKTYAFASTDIANRYQAHWKDGVAGMIQD